MPGPERTPLHRLAEELDRMSRTPLFPEIGPATAAALFQGVPGAPAVPTDPQVWEEELPAIVFDRLAGLALTAASNGNVSLPAASFDRLRQESAHRSASVLMVEERAIAVTDALRTNGIPLVITKGPGIARAYPDRSLRPFSDIDILVPQPRFNEAAAIMLSLGFHEAGPQPRPYFNHSCREAVNLKREDGASIDLHHHIPPWVWGGRIDFANIVEASESHQVVGGELPVASTEHNLLIAALHVISDKGRPGRTLMVWRDLIALSAACDVEVAVREARRSRLDWLVSYVLQELPDFAAPRELIDGLGQIAPSRRDARRMQLLLPPGIGSRHQISQAFRLPLPQALAFLAGYVFPSRTFLRSRFGRDWSYVSWWDEAFIRFRNARSVSVGP